MFERFNPFNKNLHKAERKQTPATADASVDSAEPKYLDVFWGNFPNAYQRETAYFQSVLVRTMKLRNGLHHPGALDAVPGGAELLDRVIADLVFQLKKRGVNDIPAIESFKDKEAVNKKTPVLVK